MRRPRARKPTPSALHSLVAALPDEALRPLLLELLRDVDMPAPAEDPAPAPQRAAAKRRGRRPPGRKRRGPGRPRKAIDPDIDAKIIARRQREARRLREKRRAAKETVAEHPTTDHANGAGNGGAKAPVTAEAFWRHAETLAPTKAWRAVARELGTNEAQALDAYRAGSLPPGMTANAIERFLELPAP